MAREDMTVSQAEHALHQIFQKDHGRQTVRVLQGDNGLLIVASSNGRVPMPPLDDFLKGMRNEADAINGAGTTKLTDRGLEFTSISALTSTLYSMAADREIDDADLVGGGQARA